MEPDPTEAVKPAGSKRVLCVAFLPAALVWIVSAVLRGAEFLGVGPAGGHSGVFFSVILSVQGLGLVPCLWAGFRLSPESRVGGVVLGLGLWVVNVLLSVFGCSLASA